MKSKWADYCREVMAKRRGLTLEEYKEELRSFGIIP